MEYLPDRIYVDMDETLLVSRRISQQPHWPNLPGVSVFDSNGEMWGTCLRPHAIELVEACIALAPTYYLTTGGSIFQNQVRELHGLPKIPVISWEFYNTILPARRALLIDDTEMLGCGVQSKLRAVIPEYPLICSKNYTEAEVARSFTLIHVPYWVEPTNQNDKTLLNIIPRIQEWAKA